MSPHRYELFKNIGAWFKRRWRRFRYVVVLDDEPYLVRYRLLWLPWFGIYLHHIVRPDTDRNLHDHPFSFVSLILWGGYREQLATATGKQVFTRRRRWLSYNRYRAENYHGIVGLLSKSVWTLVFRGPRTKDWGFRVPLESSGQLIYLPWQTYIGLKACAENLAEICPLTAAHVEGLERRMFEKQAANPDTHTLLQEEEI